MGAAVAQSSTSPNERRQTGESFLKGVRDTWTDHRMSMNMTADILMYLDRGYSQQEPSRVPIFTTMIGLFRDHILRSRLADDADRLVVDVVAAVMLEQINMERDGDVIDRTLIRSCSCMLTCLYETDEEREGQTLYLTLFEPRLVESSEAFYADECQRLLRDGDASAWLRHTQRRLAEEVDRCGTTVELETLPAVLAVIDRVLIRKHLQEFITMDGTGLRAMIDSDRLENLAILYRLTARIDDEKTALRDILQRRIVELGLEIETSVRSPDPWATATTTAADGDEGAAEGAGPKASTPAAQQTAAAVKWVDDVLELKLKFDKMLTQCFQDDRVMQESLDKSFTIFINMFGRASEYVSLFIDDNLKRGIRGKTEAEVEAVLDRAVVLMRHLQDKDMFQTYYQRHLARRLLHAKSESHEAEKQMIVRMKQENGQQFTSKLEGMFRDLVTSSELTAAYREHMKSVADDDDGVAAELAVSVLTTNYWPPEVMGRGLGSAQAASDGPRVGCVYPPELRRVQASFERFYLTSRNGRKLTWIGSAGSADVRCVFPAVAGKTGPLARERRYELNVPTFAMVVLLLFNDVGEGESLSFDEIQERTGISTQELMRTLTAIAVAPKSRVLLKEPATRSVKTGDRFYFNTAFVSKTVRIKAAMINAVSKVEDGQERKTTEEKNRRDRSHAIDAAVVRIMK